MEKAVLDLVYKFDEKSHCESIAKVQFKFFWSTNIPIYIYIHMYTCIYILYMDTNTDHFTPLALYVQSLRKTVSIQGVFQSTFSRILAYSVEYS